MKKETSCERKSEPKRLLRPEPSLVTAADRERLLRQKPATLWLTGLSGSGKSTLAQTLERRLTEMGHAAYVLDGDNVRRGLNRDLGFSSEDRTENIRRIAEVAGLLNDAGLIAITAFISPYRADRALARDAIGADRFIEVHMDTPMNICEQRDVKGLYRLAREGKLPEFTGISAPYESPDNPALSLSTEQGDPDQLANRVLALLQPFLAP